MTEGFTPEQDKVLDQIQKLLNLAAKNPNENESAAAAAKAQELLEKHNLSAAALERKGGEASGKRAQEEVEGGFYRYQREVWEAVARLNFCRHWVQKKWVPRDERVRKVEFKRRHILIGRVVNVRATINLSNYLLAAIERITRETCEEKKLGHLSGWAMSFREGCSYRLVSKLQDRREERVSEERKAHREAEERAAKAGVSLETALTIASFTQTEDDLNRDFQYGDEPGTTARERAERAAEARAREEAYTRWAAANPEEARAKEAAEEAERKKSMSRWRGGSSDRRYDHVDRSAFWAGDKAAESIGLDPQMGGGTKVAGRLK